jgi:hypothetical protein
VTQSINESGSSQVAPTDDISKRTSTAVIHTTCRHMLAARHRVVTDRVHVKDASPVSARHISITKEQQTSLRQTLMVSPTLTSVPHGKQQTSLRQTLMVSPALTTSAPHGKQQTSLRQTLMVSPASNNQRAPIQNNRTAAQADTDGCPRYNMFRRAPHQTSKHVN